MGKDPMDAQDTVSARRIDGDTVEISWRSRHNNPEVSIYQGTSPGSIDMQHPVDSVSSGNCARISGLSGNRRYYFLVSFQGGINAMVGERRVALEGTFNFRDLGGYGTVHGRRVKWGEVYRSDNLSRLTDNAVGMIASMGIRLVCDLRSDGEAESRPNRLPENQGIETCHLPVVQGKIDGIAAFEKIKQGDTSWFTDDFMLNGYLNGMDGFAEIWGNLISRLAEKDSRAMVFHCSAGKDRTGIAAALILSVLGVPEDTIIADHQMSNTCIAPALGDIYSRIRSYGVDPERIAGYFAAPRECIVAMLDHLRNAHGSAARFLTTRCGVPPKTIEDLRDALLE